MCTRKIISIDHQKCNGCGACIPNCPEGALQLIDGKARLVSDLFCDGLGACIGHCPEGAIQIIEREAEPYDERRVMAVIAPQGANTIKAHLEHLRGHGETELLSQAITYLHENGIPVPQGINPILPAAPGLAHGLESRLANWPIQLHLLSPLSPQLTGKDVVLSADCVAYAVPGFQEKFLKGKSLAIACPKLDEGKDVYRDKIVAMIDKARINTLTVLMMEVPCCRGLLAIAQDAASRAQRKVPLKAVVVSIESGETLAEEWV
ncbi:MAG TPA: 4Fe-4S binding protein [Spirochaetia bacterium]|nr:4Fe-4S binding protein [Spirochaetia bacterium]